MPKMWGHARSQNVSENTLSLSRILNWYHEMDNSQSSISTSHRREEGRSLCERGGVRSEKETQRNPGDPNALWKALLCALETQALLRVGMTKQGFFPEARVNAERMQLLSKIINTLGIRYSLCKTSWFQTFLSSIFIVFWSPGPLSQDHINKRFYC